MQGERSIFDPLPEPVDMNQGSNLNSTSMDESDDWNILSSMERRLLNNDLSRELNFSSVNTNNHHNLRSFSSWDVGESSSRASLQDRVSNDGLKLDHDSRLKEHRPKSSTISTHDNFLGGQVAAGSSNIHMNVNLDVGDEGPDVDDNGFHFMELYKSDRTESEASGSSHGIGPSECEPGSSLGSWGLKRKTLEGSSSQSLTGGSSSCFPESSRSLNISSSLVDPVPANCQEPPNTQIGVVTSAPGVPENSQTHFGFRGWVPYNDITSTGNSIRHPNIDISQRSSNRQLLLNEFLDQTSRGTDSGNISDQQPPLMHIPSMPRNTNHFLWGSNIGSRSGNLSSSPGLPFERSSEPNIRRLQRNHVQHHNFVPSSERNLVQDPTRWSLATGGVSTNGGGRAPPSSRNGSGSGGFRPFNSLWTPQLNSTMPSQQGSTELPPWTLFPSAGVESGGQRGPFPLFPAGSSSTSEDGHISSRVPSQRHHYQPFPRSALLMEIPGDDWRALAADIEGGQRLVSEIRQVLNAMRRGENLRAEDYMLFDPFINGVTELHDRHRDLRLDVDNMSYEELLALEERIGDVNTGLSEEVILKSMKQKKHIAFMAFSTQSLEPCCICQEEYDTGDDIGSLDCGHDFHRDCIKQWLAQKNICPICKMTGLAP